MDLRPYQLAALESLRRSLRRGHRRPILVSPTGSGKTLMAKGIIDGALAKDKRVLFLAPRRELVKQASGTLARHGIWHTVLMAGEDCRAGEDVAVASWDTLRSWIKREKIHAPHADVVLVDEAHLSLAPTYRELLETHYADAVIVGLTATPARGDGKPLGTLYDDLVIAANVGELIAQEHLVPIRYFAPTKPDLEGLKVVQGDYEARGIASRFNVPQIVGDVVAHWWRLASDRQTVVFAATIAHAIHLRDKFLESGVSADVIHCKLSNDERDEVLRKVKTGETRVICNVDVLTFGWDQPSVSCAVIARPTKSLVRYFQTVGRVLRPAPGKENALVIDHGGVVDELGFVEEPVDWQLNGDERIQDRHRAKIGKSKAKEPITCGNCRSVFAGGRKCPYCGHELPQKPRELKAVDGELEEVKNKVPKWTREQKAQFHAELLQVARNRGYSDGWADHKYREKTGVWPRGFDKRRTATPTEGTLKYVRYLDIKAAKSRQARAKREARVAV